MICFWQCSALTSAHEFVSWFSQKNHYEIAHELGANQRIFDFSAHESKSHQKIFWCSRQFFFCSRVESCFYQFMYVIYPAKTYVKTWFAHETREHAHETSFFCCSRVHCSRNEFCIHAHESSAHETSLLFLLTKRVLTKRVLTRERRTLD